MSPRWSWSFIALLIVVFAIPAPVPTSAAGATPELGIQPDVPVLREVRGKRAKRVYVGTEVFVTATGAPFDVRVTRPDYDTPIGVDQWLDDGATIVPLPATFADGWNGFVDFLHVEVTGSTGTVRFQNDVGYCPAARSVTDLALPGTVTPQRYPRFGCTGSRDVGPFMMGSVWGIDAGWGTSGGVGANFKGPDGTYTMTVSIAQPYVDAFGISPEDASTDITIKVRTKEVKRCRCAGLEGRTSTSL